MDINLYQDFYNMETKHWWFVARNKIVFSLLDKYLPNKKRLEIVDVGCGAGSVLKKLEKYGYAVGVDISDDAVKFCKLRGCTKVFVVDQEGLPFKDNTFDLVTAMDTIEHIDDDSAALAEYYRIIRKGGVLLVTVPAYDFLWGPHDEVNEHKRRYVAKELRNKMEKVGFTVKKMTYFDTFLFPFFVLIRMGHRVSKMINSNYKTHSDLKMRSPLINYLLKIVFSLEDPLLKKLNFLYGASLLCLAKKS